MYHAAVSNFMMHYVLMSYVPLWVTCLLWSYIGILMHLLIAKPFSTTGCLFPSQWYLFEMLFLTLYLMVWVWQVLRARPMIFYWPKLLAPFFLSFPVFPFLDFFLIGLYFGANVFLLISDQVSIALSYSCMVIFFFIIYYDNNNNNNNT